MEQGESDRGPGKLRKRSVGGPGQRTTPSGGCRTCGVVRLLATLLASAANQSPTLLTALVLLKEQHQSQDVFGLVLRLAYLYTSQGQIAQAQPLIHWAGWKMNHTAPPRQQLPVLLAFPHLFSVDGQPERAYSLARLIKEQPASTWAQKRTASRLAKVSLVPGRCAGRHRPKPWQNW